MNPSKNNLLRITSDRIFFDEGSVCDYSGEPRPMSAFAYMLEGCADFYEDGRVSRISPGDIIFTPQDSRYISKWHKQSLIQSIHFTFEPTAHHITDRRYTVQRLDGSDSLRDRFFLIRDHINDEDAVLSVLGSFYSMASELYAAAHYIDLPPIDPRIKKAVDFIDSGFAADRVTVEQLAELCSLSVSHFHSLFKSIMGVSPIEYKNRAAVKRAKQLMMEDPLLSIEEISEMTGFSSASYFRRVFAEQSSMSPREYKKIARRAL